MQRKKKSGASRSAGQKRRLLIWAMICTLFTAWVSVQLITQANKVSAKRAEIEKAQHTLRAAEERKQELETHIKHLHDPEYVTELARKEYYMTREGEIIFTEPR